MTETNMQLVDWLDDLCVRFIINLPHEELNSVERICFQVEEAQWFYEDFIRPLDPNLPSLNLRQFCLRIFQHCPLFSQYSEFHHTQAFSEFLAYKTRVPVRGAIMLNDAMNQVVLVKGWKKGANWSFPRGKINKDEKDLDCAVREVFEETGFDIQAAGLVGKEEDMKSIEITMREQHMLMYVFRGAPMDTHFEPRTRKEISKIEWWKLSDLPTLKKNKHHQDGRSEELVHNANKFYMVAPFLNQLKKWISLQRKNDALKASRVDNTPPTVARDGIVSVGNSSDQNGISEPRVENDLSRLVASLRQSSGRVPTVSDFPELSNPIETAKDASIQLKNLLRVPTTEPRLKSDPPISPIDETKSNALLSLLRSNTSSGQLRSKSQVPLPKTPFDQITEPPQLPQSPKHHTHQPLHLSTTAPPPAFPFQPAHGEGVSQAGQSGSVDKQNLPSGSVQYPTVSSRHVQQPKLIPNQLPYTYHVSNSAHRPITPRVVQPAVQPHRQAIAPYHRTGDPQFARPSNFSESHEPFIPPANKLPPPKMTSHSSALLSIFKGGQSTLPATNKRSLEARHNPQPRAETENDVETDDVHHVPRIETPVTGLTGQGSTSQLPAGLSRPRSQHQDALLDIFRKSAAPSTKANDPNLLPSREPAELSAQPSPGHSREPSQAEDMSNRRPHTNLQNGQVMIQKRPVTRGKPSTAPVSATVSGPLNIPQFEKVSKKSRSTLNANGNQGKELGLDSQKLGSITILPRPAMHTSTSGTAAIKANSPKEASDRKYPQATSSQSKPAKVSKEAPKPFQPQILRRPAAQQQSPKELPASSSVQESSRTQPALNLDRRTSQVQEHRQTLLNLFNIASSQNSPTTPAFTTSVSPMSEKPTRPGSVVPPPLSLSTSKLGSVGTLVGDAGMKVDSAKTTPKTTPVSRSFLLGYLEGVAKGEGN